MTQIQTSCPCGAVTIELSGDSVAHFYCHCDDCQIVHSAGFVPVAMFPAAAVKITGGQPRVWQLKMRPRFACPECGTRLFADLPEMGLRGVVAHLLPRGTFKPTFHIQCQHAMTPIKDDLPHFKGYPKAFGGSDETVAW